MRSPGTEPRLDNLFDELAATPSSPLPYQRDVRLRSFVLTRRTGTVIVYNSPGIDDCAAEIRGRGMPSRLLMNHAHESMHGPPELEVPLWIHERDRVDVDQVLPLAGTFTGEETLDDDLCIIPTPGHTAGTTSFLWDSGAHRFLFTGDFLWVEHGEWSAVVLDEELRGEYVRSLETVRDLDFDVLVPWGVTAGDPPAVLAADEADRRRRITRVIERVAEGGSR